VEFGVGNREVKRKMQSMKQKLKEEEEKWKEERRQG
jgi:hypothetical protein